MSERSHFGTVWFVERSQPLIEPKAFRWPDPEAGPYSIRVSVATVEGRPEVVGVEFWGADPSNFVVSAQEIPPTEVDTPITSTAIRIPLREVLTDLLADFQRQSELIVTSPAASPGLKDSVTQRQDRMPADAPRRGRRPTYGPAFFALVTRVYTEAMGRREPPTVAVAQWGHVSKSTAAKWVSKARELSLLPPTSRGRAAVHVEPTEEGT